VLSRLLVCVGEHEDSMLKKGSYLNKYIHRKKWLATFRSQISLGGNKLIILAREILLSEVLAGDENGTNLFITVYCSEYINSV
jgi:hypothetical protein